MLGAQPFLWMCWRGYLRTDPLVWSAQLSFPDFVVAGSAWSVQLICSDFVVAGSDWSVQLICSDFVVAVSVEFPESTTS